MDVRKHDGLHELLLRREYERVGELFEGDSSSVRRRLVRLTYSPESELRARAVEALRYLSECFGRERPEFFRETMRRHLWGMNEEGGNVDWSAPEIVAAVIAGQPILFGQFASYMICAALEEPTFHPSLRAAVVLLAEVDEGLVREFRPALESLSASG